MQRLGAPARSHQLVGQILEQLGVGRGRAGVAQVVGRGGESGAEMMLPDPVGQHASQEGRRPRAGLGQPARQGQPPAGRAAIPARAVSARSDCRRSVKKSGTPGPTFGPGVAGLPRSKSGISAGLLPAQSPTQAIRPGFGRRRPSSASMIGLSGPLLSSYVRLGTVGERPASRTRAISASIDLFVGLPARQLDREVRRSRTGRSA